jgi:hypothetical protein
VLRVAAQERNSKSSQKGSRQRAIPSAKTDLAKLREEFIAATKEYKSSLEKLVSIYQGNVKKAEDKLAQSRKLFDEGLIARNQVDENERAVESAKSKLADTQKQMVAADTQIADVFVEARADEQLAKSLHLAKGHLVRTTGFIRYNGAAGWNLGDAWKVQRFFSDTFHKSLPVAVFGQGVIHDRWRLDHRNAMDISLHPDGVEGQAVMEFLQKNGIPFSAFREAIPGTATGPHIHIGRPSHRY